MECATDKQMSQYLCAKYKIKKSNIRIRVISDCMSPLIEANDVVEVAQSDSYLKGNVVAIFINGNIYIHRIISVEEGRVTTKGDKSFNADPSVDSKMIIGIVSRNISRQIIIKKNSMGSQIVVLLSMMESNVFNKIKCSSNHANLKEIYYIRKFIDFFNKLCTKKC